MVPGLSGQLPAEPSRCPFRARRGAVTGVAKDKKPEPKPSRADIRHWNRTKDKPPEAFCPKCAVWYPSSSDAHAGH